MDQKKGESRVRDIITLVLLAVMLASGAMNIRNWMENKRVREEYERLTRLAREAATQPSTEAVAEPEKPETESYVSSIDFEELMRGNPGTIGWIQVSDTNIDYPIVWREDNDFCLNHDLYSKENIAGTIYLGFESQRDFIGQDNVLYGHNMKSGSIFKDMNRYKNETYFEEHQFFGAYTPDRGVRLKAMTAYYRETQPVVRGAGFKSRGSFDVFIYEMVKPCSYGDEITYPTKTLYTLITCSYEINDARTYLSAMKVGEDGNQVQPDDVLLQCTDELMGGRTKDRTQEAAWGDLQKTADSAKEGGQQETIIYDGYEFPVKGFIAVSIIIYTSFLHKKTHLGIGKQNELCYAQRARRIYAQESKARRV